MDEPDKANPLGLPETAIEELHALAKEALTDYPKDWDPPGSDEKLEAINQVRKAVGLPPFTVR